MTLIRTVLGDIKPEDAGVVLPHEHTVVGWPGVELDHRAQFDWDQLVVELTEELTSGKKLFGLKTLVDCTTAEMGRQPHRLSEASRQSGVNIVAVTGFFCESMGIPYHWRRQTINEIKDFFIRDIKEGMAGTDIKCGLIKVASGQDDAQPRPAPKGPGGRHIGHFEDRIFRAAGRAQKEIGVPITTHIDPEDWNVTNIGLEQLEILMEEGADPTKIVIGHTFYATIDQLADILKHGAYVQLDNIGTKWRGLSDEKAVDLIFGAIDRGYEDQLLISFDRYWCNIRGAHAFTDMDPEVATRMPLGFLPDTFLPLMREKGVSDEVINKMMVDNPARVFAFE